MEAKRFTNPALLDRKIPPYMIIIIKREREKSKTAVHNAVEFYCRHRLKGWTAFEPVRAFRKGDSDVKVEQRSAC